MSLPCGQDAVGLPIGSGDSSSTPCFDFSQSHLQASIAHNVMLPGDRHRVTPPAPWRLQSGIQF